MANYHVFRTPRLTDRQIVVLISALQTASDVDVESGVVHIGNNIELKLNSNNKSQKIFSNLCSDRHSIHYVALTITEGITIQFYRGTCSDINHPGSNRQASPYFDELFLQTNNKDVETALLQWNACIDAIETALPRTYPFQETNHGTDVIDVLRTEMAALADQYRKMLTVLTEEQQKFWKDSAEERKAFRLDNAATQQRYKIEQEKRISDFNRVKQQEEERLQSINKELVEQRKILDDRQHMHARRDLRERISADYKERVGRPVVSKTAQRMRWIVFSLSLGFGIVSGYFSLVGFGELVTVFSSEDVSIGLQVLLVLRSTLIGLLAFGFIAYSISWLRAMYHDDVRAERRNEKYGDDIDRASFVIETVLEVGKNENVQVPMTWVESVCRNLFDEDVKLGHSRTNPYQMLMTLMENISGAKFGPDGTEISIDRRGLRGLAKKKKND